MAVLIEKLPNGCQLVAENNPQSASISLGIFVGAGSTSETKPSGGISHFIEHMTFKGTKKRSAFEIAHTLDAVGGRMNAFTSREYTCYYATVRDANTELALDLLADIFNNSLYRQTDIKTEKGVILEEIKMYEDTPDELIHDFFVQAILGDHPMGRPIIGTVASVKSIDHQAMMDYRKKFYAPDNVIISIAGKLDPAKTISRIKDHFGHLQGKKVTPKQPPARILPKIKTLTKKTEQVHLCLGTKGISYHNDQRYCLTVMDCILGATMSSRLFQEVREKRGLVYFIHSLPNYYSQNGLWGVYAGTSPANSKQVVELVLAELSKVKAKGITKKELATAQEHIKGSTVLELERNEEKMAWNGRSLYYYDRVIPLEETFKKISAVTLDDVQKLAHDLFHKKYLTLAAIGPFDHKPIKFKPLDC